MRLISTVLLLGLVACTPKSGDTGDIDGDNDGVPASSDCDDTDPGVNPLASESCDGEDDDCDGVIDEGAFTTWYLDADGDDAGDRDVTLEACETPGGYTDNNADCDDANAAVSPWVAEGCDGVDNDCDTAIDEAGGDELFFVDADGDGYGNPLEIITACPGADGISDNAEDCDDSDPAVSPEATEVYYDGVDADCSGDNDYDADGDGFTWDGSGGSDCQDDTPEVNPDAAEICNNGIDDNCDSEGCTALMGSVSADTSDARVLGDAENSEYGRDLTSADLNGDGLLDLVTANLREVHLHTGPLPARSEADDADARFTTYSATNISVSANGDANGDGISDLLVGLADSDAGVTWLFSGGSSLSGVLVTSDAAAILSGAITADDFGHDVAWIPDLDGDGGDEVLIGAPSSRNFGGEAYLFTDAAGELAAEDAQVIFQSNHYGSLGYAVNGVGDLDGDGLSEVGLGAVGSATETPGGAAYVFFGADDWSGALDTTDADIDIRSYAQSSEFGYVIGPAGDLNNDGRDDLLVTSWNENRGDGSYTGAAFVFFGGAVGTLAASDAEFIAYGEADEDRAGDSAVGAMDFNGDGQHDLAIGACCYTDDAVYEGRSYLFYGPMLGVTNVRDADLTITAPTGSSLFGSAITAGDFSGDGIDDLAIGSTAPVGGVHLLFGVTAGY